MPMNPPETRMRVRMFTGGKRARMLDCTVIGSFGFTDDGCCIHIATGLNVPPPLDDDGEVLFEIHDDRAYVLHLLETIPPDVLKKIDAMEWGDKPDRKLARA